VEGGGPSESFIREFLICAGDGAEELPPIILFVVEVRAELLI
jgi:hypothetical protein